MESMTYTVMQSYVYYNIANSYKINLQFWTYSHRSVQ